MMGNEPVCHAGVLRDLRRGHLVIRPRSEQLSCGVDDELAFGLHHAGRSSASRVLTRRPPILAIRRPTAGSSSGTSEYAGYTTLVQPRCKARTTAAAVDLGDTAGSMRGGAD